MELSNESMAKRPNPPPQPMHGGTEHAVMRWLSYAGLGAGALSLTPVIVGALAMPAHIPSAWASAKYATDLCSYAPASGLAAGINGIIGHVPLVGTALAAGGWAAISSSVGLAIGGMLLGHYLDKHQKPGGLPWGKIVRWGCLITSALIAAPLVLSGMTMGLAFFSNYFQWPGLEKTALSTIGTLGKTGELAGAAMARSGAATVVVHALTCGLPLGFSSFFLGKKHQAPVPENKMRTPSIYEGPLKLKSPPLHAAI